MPETGPAYRDRLPNPVLPAGETLLAQLRADRGRYIRDHLILAAAGGVLVVGVLLVLGKTDQLWAGILGVMAALTLRGAWLYSDYMRAEWLLTDRALLGPGAQRIELREITRLRPLLSDVQVTAEGGRQVLLKYMSDPKAVIARIEAAR